MGIPAIFIRLSACNLMCGGYGTEKDGHLHDGATWRCDTIEVWRKGNTYTFAALLAELEEKLAFSKRIHEGAHLVITGGEPLLQQKRIVNFLAFLHDKSLQAKSIEIETNGSIAPNGALQHLISHWNVSPKLRNSGMPLAKRFFPSIISLFNAQVGSIFKFVISSESDWQEIQQTYLPLINRQKIWLMPAADNRPDLITKSQEVSALAIQEGLRFSSRLQVKIWDQTTGV